LRVFLVALIFVAFLPVACGGDDDGASGPSDAGPPSGSAEASSTALSAPMDEGPTDAPTGTSSADIDAFRDFARQVADAVAARDAEFFVDRVVEIDLTCDGSQEFGPCGGEEAGSVVSGLPGSAYETGGASIIPREEYAATMDSRWALAVETSDDFGAGEPRLFAIGRESTGLFTTYQTLIGEISSGTEDRLTFVHRWQEGSGGWQLVGETLVLSSPGSTDWLSSACAECYDYFELWEE
jgi:hypothetical protein